jgi:hypothetical protein
VLNKRFGPERTIRKESVEGAVAQPRLNGDVTSLPQRRLSFESAVREVARAVTDYIVSSRLTQDDAYQAYRVEFVSEIPLAQLPGDEMDLMGDLCAAVAAKVALNPLDIVRAELSLSGTFLVGGGLVTVSPKDTLEQILGKISQRLTGLLPVSTGAPLTPGEPAASALEPGQTFVVGWTPATGPMQAIQEALTGPAVPGSGFQGNGFMGTDDGALAALPGMNTQIPDGELTLSTNPTVGVTIPTDATQKGVSADTAVSTRAAEASAGLLTRTSGEGAAPLDALRVDLRGVAGGPLTELRIRYDAATIVNQVGRCSRST